MAQILDEFPEDIGKLGRTAGFKDEWFDGQVRALQESDLKHYSSINSARTSLMKQCVARGLDYKLAVCRGILYFQVVKENVTA